MPFRSRYVDCRIQYVIAKINERVCRDCPDLQELARTLNISPSHLRHLFKHEVGVSPNKYIKLMRLEKLRALLMGSKIQIKEAIAVTTVLRTTTIVWPCRYAVF